MSKETFVEKRNISIGLISSSVVFFLVALYCRSQDEQAIYRFFIGIAFAPLGLSVRVYLPQMFSDVKEKEGTRFYIYSFLMLIMISALIYLGFYDTFSKLGDALYYFLSFCIFGIMGLTVKTALKNFNM